MKIRSRKQKTVVGNYSFVNGTMQMLWGLFLVNQAISGKS
jgi:hypothetical protein